MGIKFYGIDYKLMKEINISTLDPFLIKILVFQPKKQHKQISLKAKKDNFLNKKEHNKEQNQVQKK